MESIYKEKEWALLQQKKENGELCTYELECVHGKIIYRFIKKIAGVVNGVEYYDIASYRGAQGPYIESKSEEEASLLLDKFNDDFDKYCEKKHIIAEFAKLDPWTDYSGLITEKTGAEYYGNYYCNDLTCDFYHEQYNRRSKRSIKKAKEAGVTVEFDFEGKTINDFLRLYRNTELKFNTSDYYIFDENDLKEYFDRFSGRCFFSNAVLNGEIITSVLSAMGKDVVHYLYLGTNPEYLKYQANSLLTYETSVLGQEMNRKIFDMGGGKAGGNIEQFKLNFTGDDGVIKYYAIKKIRNEEIYNKLVSGNINNIKNENFFPKYRG